MSDNRTAEQLICDECRFTRDPHEHRCLDPETCQCVRCNEVKQFAQQTASLREELESWKKEHFETVEMAAANMKELQQELELKKERIDREGAYSEKLKKENETLNKYNDLLIQEKKQLQEEVDRLRLALEKCQAIFKRLADEGKYPDFMLQSNGGYGFQFITEALSSKGSKPS